MVMTTDGKRRYGNKMKANRYNREQEGKRAEAHQVEGRKGDEPAEPKEEPRETPEMEGQEEEMQPGMHDEIKQIAVEHGPAHQIGILHDHEGQRSRVHSVHQDGHEHHKDHEGPDHAMHAHHHAMHAAGVTVPEQEEDGEGEYPAEHKNPTANGEEDDYTAEPI